MRAIISRNLNGRKVLFLFIITNVVYLVMLAITIPRVMNYTQGMKLLDMMPTGYSAEYVNSLFSALGDNGRHAYLYNQIPVDMVYPLLFAISSCLVLAYFLNKLNRLDGNLFYLCFIPLFSGVFDYSENLGIISMLNIYPHYSNVLIETTCIFSILKSFCTMSYFIILIITLIAFGVNKLGKKRLN